MVVETTSSRESTGPNAAGSAGPAGPGHADGLRARDPLFLLAHRIFRAELDALRANLRPQKSLPLPQEIHHARIALRRLRVALSVYRDFTPAQIERYRIEFRWLGQALGEMRDLDVYEETIGGTADDAVELPAVVKRNIARARKAASARLVSLLGSKRFADLLTSFSDFVDSELPPGVQRRWRSLRIRDAIATDLRKSVKRVLKLGRKIDAETDVEVLHELRIRAKRLRYESEFYSDFAPDLGKLTRSAKQLQDLLGAHRDALAAADRLRALARAVKSESRAASADENPAAGIVPLVRRQNERAASLRRGFPDAWRRFEKTVSRTRSRD